MEEDKDQRLKDLAEKAERLTMAQERLANDLRLLKDEIRKIKSGETQPAEDVRKIVIEQPKPVLQPVNVPPVQQEAKPETPRRPREKTPLEEFIGTNLLNKIGIAVLVLGLAFGAKYAIDHDLISPLTRIVLGYGAGLILIGIAIRLKVKYHGFSAVLLSGGMAVLYFMTYAAYDLYALIPQMVAFVLMVVFTAFTVFASLQYDLFVIAIIGLVGAYAVPFLLSDGSGKVAIMFSYMSIVNAGILVLSFKKTWKSLYYTAFAFTWIIFSVWCIDQYYAPSHLWISLSFSTIFFITFYITFLSYKLIQQEPLTRWDIVLLLLNSFFYFGWGYFSIDDHAHGEMYLGLFTLFNAVLHFIACYLIYKRQDATRDTFYFVAGMVLVFLTLAVPVQLEGHWVTLIWAAEAALLFWIGRTKGFPVYEKLSYILMLLTFISLTQDWNEFYEFYNYDGEITNIPFVLNIQFLSSLLVCASWGFIIRTAFAKPLEASSDKLVHKLLLWILPGILILSLFMSFANEINAYFEQRYLHSEIKTIEQEYSYSIFDEDLRSFEILWTMLYASAFIFGLWFINQRWLKNKYLTFLVAGSAAFLLIAFITEGLIELSQLRTSYLTQENAQYYFRTSWHLIIRYVCIVVIVPLLYLIYNGVRQKNLADAFIKIERVFFHLVILVLLSNELISTLDLTGIENSDRLALSILWGGYALGLIIFGLMHNQRFIRIVAICLFGITLIKLFIYDWGYLGTIAKPIVMVTLGALLLSASFLYNKFKVKNNEE